MLARHANLTETNFFYAGEDLRLTKKFVSEKGNPLNMEKKFRFLAVISIHCNAPNLGVCLQSISKSVIFRTFVSLSLDYELVLSVGRDPRKKKI